MGTRKQMLTQNTLEECKRVDKKGGIGSNFIISQLIDAQDATDEEIKHLKAQNNILQSKLNQASEEPGFSSA